MNSTDDPGPGACTAFTCTLHDAIVAVNSSPLASQISFAIPGAGPHTITLAAALPSITNTVTIDGYTQPGASANTLAHGDDAVLEIEINGADVASPSVGLNLYGANSVVRGLVLNRFAAFGNVAVDVHADNGTVAGNFIGTDVAGTSALPNYDGVSLDAHNGRLGGVSPADRNLLSGNAVRGAILDLGSNNLIAGNFIGTDRTGTLALGNSSGVVAFSSGSIGNGTAGAGNVISGNAFWGILLLNSNCIVQGNFVGTDATGTIAVPNADIGVYVDVADNNIIGGLGAMTGNLIAGNGSDGISVTGNFNLLVGNQIGTDITGTQPLGNARWGVHVSAELFPANNNQILGNTIAFNAQGGVSVEFGGALGNTIQANSIFRNGNIGIDLGLDGTTPNDLCDPDSGANNLQNFPIISSVAYGANTVVTGLLNATASTVFQLDFYANSACSNFPREFLQGQTYLGSTQVTTDVNCNGSFQAQLPATAPGTKISATATDPAGNTSEFSQRLPFSITPTSGLPAGGTAIAIAGTNFLAGATVAIGSQPATGVNVVSYTLMGATTPPLAPGTANDLVVTNADGTSGTLVKAWVADFLDVPNGNQFYSFVTTLISNDVTVGIGGGLYGVNDNTLRQQMAALILKAKHGLCYVPPSCSGVFMDVPCPSTFADWIEELRTEGITGGCGGTNFCPQNPVRRDQMAVFLLKGEHGSSYLPPTCTGLFTDVPCPSTFADWVEQLFRENITGGCGSGVYCPANDSTRGQMAVFITKTFNLQ